MDCHTIANIKDSFRNKEKGYGRYSEEVEDSYWQALKGHILNIKAVKSMLKRQQATMIQEFK